MPSKSNQTEVSNCSTGEQSHRKIGAPKGNLNAIKHGYYSRTFKKLEREDLDLINENLQSEINALRVIGRRIMTQLKQSNLDQATLLSYINTMLKITLSISKLYNTKSIIEQRIYQPDNSIESILQEIHKELNINQNE